MQKSKITIPIENLAAVNAFLHSPDNKLVNDLLALIDSYGGVKEINKKAEESGKVENLLAAVEKTNPAYTKDLNWLIEQKEKQAFVNVDNYRANVLGDKAKTTTFDDSHAVTLEICSCSFFPFFMEEAKQALEKQEVMPGRIIRVRSMKEQEADGDLPAVQAAAKIIGASCCETLDTKGTDGSNIHLGGPATITGYFGGVGQPNEHAIKWADEFLHYYTKFGVKEVLNVNHGTINIAYMMHNLGVNNEFKISVFTGHDNPYYIFWTLASAKLFSRPDGSTSLKGFNFSNSVNNETIEVAAQIRKALGLEDAVRFEHHILETQKSIVIQPYDRRDELLDVATRVKNIAAKHEGGDVSVDSKREHPSDILEYFMPKAEIMQKGLMPCLLRNYMDKHDAVNNTAYALTKRGMSFVAAKNLHYHGN